MGKRLTRLASCCLVFLLMFSTFILVGCGDDSDGSTYSGSQNVEKDVDNISEFAINYDECTLFVDEKVTLRTNAVGKVTWSSSNSSVASVSYNGVVTAKSRGYATITAKNSSGQKVYCDITVEAVENPKPAAISLTSFNIKNYCTITVAPTTSTNKQTTFKGTLTLSSAYDVESPISVNIIVKMHIKYKANNIITPAYKSGYISLGIMSSYYRTDTDTKTITYNYSQITDIDYEWDISSCYGKIIPKM